MYTAIIEQTKKHKMRMVYDPETKTFNESGFESLFYARKCDFPYGWIKGFGTPPEDHLDVIVITEKDYELGQEVMVNIIGIFKRNDGDHKLVAVPESSSYSDISDLSKEDRQSLQALYPKLAEGEGWYGKAFAVLERLEPHD